MPRTILCSKLLLIYFPYFPAKLCLFINKRSRQNILGCVSNYTSFKQIQSGLNLNLVIFGDHIIE